MGHLEIVSAPVMINLMMSKGDLVRNLDFRRYPMQINQVHQMVMREGVWPTGEQSACSEVSREDIKKTEEQKREAYRELDTLLDKSGQGTLAVSKSETRGTFEISSEHVNKLVEKAIHGLEIEEKRHIDPETRKKSWSCQRLHYSLRNYADCNFCYRNKQSKSNGLILKNIPQKKRN